MKMDSPTLNTPNFSPLSTKKMQVFMLCLLSILLLVFAANPAYAQKAKIKKIKQKLPYLEHIKTAEEISEIYNKFDRFKYQIIGHFSNREQVEAGKTFEPLQEFVIMPIFQERPGEFWVYLEFFSPEVLESPVDQRIEQYVQVTRDSFRMEVYYIKKENQAKYINAWKHKEFPETDIRKDLIRDEGCDLMIAHQKDKKGTFKTVFPEQVTCEMLNAKGTARYVDLEFELSDTEYNMWFHFYDKEKEHMKKTDKNGLIFKRLEFIEMEHMIGK